MKNRAIIHKTYGIVFCFLLLLGFSASAEPRSAPEAQGVMIDAPDCHSESAPSPLKFLYCFRKGTGRADTLLVYMHGASRDERWVFSGFDPSLKAFGLKGPNAPSVLSLSFGRFMFLSRWKGLPASGDIQEMTQRVAYLIARYRSQVGASKVVLMGESMGGFNAIQTFLRIPHLFNRVALICPALSSTSPFASDAEWDSDSDTIAANSIIRTAFRQVMRWFFGDHARWELNSPLEYIHNRFEPWRGPNIKFLVGTVKGDPYGFLSAVDLLANRLRAHNFDVQRVEVASGRHCHFDSVRLASFLFDSEDNLAAD